MAIGAITVPAYTTNTEADHLHILENSGASAVIVSTRKLAQRLLPAAMRCPNIRFVIAIDELGLHQQPDFEVLTWREVMARGERDHTNIRAQPPASSAPRPPASSTPPAPAARRRA